MGLVVHAGQAHDPRHGDAPPGRSRERKTRLMALTEYVFVAVGARDLAAADAVVEVLRTVEPADITGSVDVVSIGRKRNGEVRFHSEASDPEPSPSRVSAAAGLAAALYPSVGADLPADRAAHRAALNAVAGRVADAVGRPAVMQFGEVLDASSAAVIAVAHLADRDVLLDALTDSDSVVVCTGTLDIVFLEHVAAVARATGSPRDGSS
jgi:hypothetical protein